MLKYKVIVEEVIENKTGEPVKGIKDHMLCSSESKHHQVAQMMLLPLELANLAYYHGHVCPELVVGYRAVLLAREESGSSAYPSHLPMNICPGK